MIHRLRTYAASAFPQTVSYAGAQGTAWFAGTNPRAPTIAAMFCGDDAHITARRRVRHGRVPAVAHECAAGGGLAVVRTFDPAGHTAIEVPLVVHQYAALPDSLDALHAQLRTSTTREDLRRIRKANLTYRVSNDSDTVNEFYNRYYLPLLTERYPEDAAISSAADLLKWLDKGGELVCADDGEGEWIAAFFNVAHDDDRYALNWMGVRDGDLAIRDSRVIAALYVRSMERGVELGKTKATFGRSLPFLGKGLVWFKAKWGGIIACDPNQRGTMHIIADVRHAPVQRMLAATPLIVCDPNAPAVSLAAVCWLNAGDEALRSICRDSSRFPGIERWYVMGSAATLAAGVAALCDAQRITPIVVQERSPNPCWLGESLR